jgi:very-short-patch-repair endonuclease
MGYTRSSASYYGFFGILAVTVYAISFLAASDYIGTWTAGTSRTSELLAEGIYRAGLVSAGALGAIFGLGFAARRRGPANLAGCVLSVLAGIMLVVMGIEGTGVGEDFFWVFASLISLVALADVFARSAGGEYIPSVISSVLALLIAATYYFEVLYGLGFIIASAVWVLSASVVMLVCGPGQETRDAKVTADGPGPDGGTVSACLPASDITGDFPEVSSDLPEGPSERPGETSPVGRGVGQTSGTVSEEETQDLRDTYTDNSPEALVRRAAFNKGLRCRKNYGEHGIQIAFVAPRVAVFVQPEGYDDSLDDRLRSEGWAVLRYSEESVTDGSIQGEEILATVRKSEKQRARYRGKSAS